MAASVTSVPPPADLSDAKRALLEKLLAGGESSTSAPAIPRRPAGARVPLSYSQQGLWFFHQLDPQSPLYNLPIAFHLEGQLDLAALQLSLRTLVNRHEVLRTHILEADGAPTQSVATAVDLVVHPIDLTGHPAEGRDAAVQALVDAECRRPFDLTRDILLRALVVQTTATEHTLVLTTHHIAADGWSWGVFFQELAALYRAYAAGREPTLRPLPLDFGDFALWQHERWSSPTGASELAYWRKQLADAPEFLALPTDRPRPPWQTFRGAWVQRTLSARLTGEVRTLSRHEGATLFMTLLATFQVLLYRYSDQADLIVGTTMAGRTQQQLEESIGCFVNTLPLRGNLAGDPTFREFLRLVRTTCLDAFSHQEFPFEKLVEELRPTRSPGYSPLVQVMFTLQDTRAQGLVLPGLRATRLETTTDTAKFDLSLMVSEGEHTLTMVLEYNRDLFDTATAQQYLRHFETLLESIVADPVRRLGELPLLSPAERHQLLRSWNDTRTDYPRDATIAELFEEQAERRPEAIAVEFGDRRVTYRELNRQSNRLAHRLRAAGVGPDVPVALCLERSPQLIVALLGILKAGGAYAALDPEYPPERLAFMLEDLQAPVLLTQRSLWSGRSTPAAQAIFLDEIDCVVPDAPSAGGLDESALEPTHAASSTAAHLAYISYTSGSTGPDETFLQFAPVGFDASTFEIWGALLNGARLVVFPPGTPSLAELGACIAQRGVTTLWLTSGLFHALVDHSLASLRGVRQLLAGGDTLSPAHAQKVLLALPHCRLINGYGPTENTTFTCTHAITAVEGALPIGRPIANTEVYILDARREPVPIGVAGELWVGGDGLAHGYLRRPELTAEKFPPHPFQPGARLYRTGDRARHRADGTIAFLGRDDRQVKIHGFRVELAEIERHLLRHPAVRACAVTAPLDATGGRSLVAHLVSTAPVPSAEALRTLLQSSLPRPLLPAVWLFRPALPLTPNGKVDYRALAVPVAAPGPRPVAVAPRDHWEETLVKLWESVLGVAPVGVTDRFFDLGGHSLLALRLVAQIEKAFGRRLAVATLFQAQSVAELAAILRENRSPAPGRALLALQPAGGRAPLYFVHGVGGGMLWGYGNLSRHLGPDQPVYVFRAERPAGGYRGESIEEIAARLVRELRLFQPAGPYALGGYCFGGNVAFEMARLLEAQGQPVALLALMNSSPPNSAYHRFRWTPVSLGRFLANLAFWIADFLTWDRDVRGRYVRWRVTQCQQRLARWCGRKQTPAAGDPDGIVNLLGLPPEEQHLYEAHLHALTRYRCRPYGGHVLLIRTRGHPLVSSFDPHYGWGEFVTGGITLCHLPGSHESLLQEPHVKSVAQVLAACPIGQSSPGACQAVRTANHPAGPASFPAGVKPRPSSIV